jgi:hypothetical protein
MVRVASLSQRAAERRIAMRRSDIDDAPRTAQNLFDRLAGPEPSNWELALTAIALVGTVYVAHADALPSWSRAQYTTAIALAVIDGSAAVQCTTAQSKRWYHPLTPQLAKCIAFEAVVQCALIGWLYCETENAKLELAVHGSAFFAVASAALFTCPLHAQRPLSLLLLLLAFALGRRAPPTPGLEWARVVLPVKYLASHPIRAEPYALEVSRKRR